MKLAANLGFLYRELPPLERIDAAAADGFDGVEWPFPYDVPPSQLLALLHGVQLPLVLINTPLGPNGEPGWAAVAGQQTRFRDGLSRALDLAQHTGCRRVHVMAGRPEQAEADGGARALAELEHNLQWALPLARQAGVTLLLEALNRRDMPGYAYHRPDQALGVLQRLEDDHAGLLFDLYHLGCEGLDLAAMLSRCRSWIRHVQWADAPLRSTPDLARPGVAQALATLRDWRCADWLGLEYHPPGATTDSLGWRDTVRQLLDLERSLPR